MITVDKFNELCKVLAEKQDDEVEQYLLNNNINIRNKDGTYRIMRDILRECVEVFSKENDND